MRIRARIATRAVASLLALGVAGSGAWAEVSTDTRFGSDVQTLIMSPATITDDADPIPQDRVHWEPFRPLNLAAVLNPSGDVRPDGPPDVAWWPGTNRPVVVWAYNNGNDHDIAIAEWSADGAWSPTEYLTGGTEDELDPRIFLGPDGTLYVVWWVRGDGDDRVMLAIRASGSVGWQPAVRVSDAGETASRPSVVTYQGVPFVAYERQGPAPTGGQEVVVRRFASAADGFLVDHVIVVARTRELDPVLHVRGTHLWLDWKQADDQFGFVWFTDQTWNEIGLQQWADPSWVGEEGVRRLIGRTPPVATLTAPDE